MKIASADLQMASSHASLQQREIRESLRITTAPPAAPPVDEANISDAGKAADAADKGDAVDLDPQLSLLRTVIEMLTGKRIKVFDASRLTAPDAAAAPSPSESPAQAAPNGVGYGLDYRYHETYAEIETTRFAAAGVIRTADGREISFQLELTMARAFFEESDFRLQAGDAARQKDPLVINFSGTAGQLDDRRFAFDLDADGTSEQIHFAGAGSGFLALDRNGNGRIDDGNELFGPGSGGGFRELAALDRDGNGWIDENDATFAQLKVWQKNPDGSDALSSLADRGIGAIGLARVATPFAVRGAENQSYGMVRSSGIVLHEDGTAGTIQQIDLTA